MINYLKRVKCIRTLKLKKISKTKQMITDSSEQGKAMLMGGIAGWVYIKTDMDFPAVVHQKNSILTSS